MIIGSVVLATDQGLGYLAKEFFDNGIVQKVFIKDHSRRKNHYEWYPEEAKVRDSEELLECCDVLLFFETPINWKLIPQAREKGIKTVLMPMYECTNNPLPYIPDLILCPSLLDVKYFKNHNVKFLPVPVDVKWRYRKSANVFVHNAGNLGLGGRNGTKEVIEAMRYVKSSVRLIIRAQEPIPWDVDPKIEVKIGQFPKKDMFREGDVFLFPEKFNGLSLPLQEAFASGMLVMAGDRFPINTWLPKSPLIKPSHYTKEKIAVEFDCAQYDPKEIAKKIDSWQGKSIEKYSLMGMKYNFANSWRALKKRYLRLMGSL